MTLAPIAYFCFNRPEHTRRTLEALSANTLASESDLLVYSDGPRTLEDVASVQRVREIAATATGFKSVTVLPSFRNQGVAAGILRGIRTTFLRSERLIAVEDDILTAPYFLEFMNDTLSAYERDRRMFAISGYRYAGRLPEDYEHDVFMFRRFCAWGWASWADRWATVILDHATLSRLARDVEWRLRLDEGGTDLWTLAQDQVAGRIDTWDVQACVEAAAVDSFTVFPRHALTTNIGFDSSGTHTASPHGEVEPMATDFLPQLPDRLEPDDRIRDRLLEQLR